MHRLIVAALALACVNAASAAPNFNLYLGTRDETHSEDRLPSVGGAVDFGKDTWRVRPELGLAAAFDPFFGGSEVEFSAGALGVWGDSRQRFHFGGGAVSISSDWGANTGSSAGVYLHGGASWRGRRLWVGFDVRYLDASDFVAYGYANQVGYLQAALLLGW